MNFNNNTLLYQYYNTYCYKMNNSSHQLIQQLKYELNEGYLNKCQNYNKIITITTSFISYVNLQNYIKNIIIETNENFENYKNLIIWENDIYELDGLDINIYSKIKNIFGLIVYIDANISDKYISIIKFYIENNTHMSIIVIIDYTNFNNQNNSFNLDDSIGFIKSNPNIKICEINFSQSQFIDKSNNSHLKNLYFLNPHSKSIIPSLICWYYYKKFLWFDDYEKKFKFFIDEIMVKSKTPSETPCDNDINLNNQLNILIEKFKNNEITIDLWTKYNKIYLIYTFINMYGYYETLNVNNLFCNCWKNIEDKIYPVDKFDYTKVKNIINKVFSIMILHDDIKIFDELYASYYKYNDVVFCDDVYKQNFYKHIDYEKITKKYSSKNYNNLPIYPSLNNEYIYEMFCHQYV